MLGSLNLFAKWCGSSIGTSFISNYISYHPAHIIWWINLTTNNFFVMEMLSVIWEDRLWNFDFWSSLNAAEAITDHSLLVEWDEETLFSICQKVLSWNFGETATAFLQLHKSINFLLVLSMSNASSSSLSSGT